MEELFDKLWPEALRGLITGGVILVGVKMWISNLLADNQALREEVKNLKTQQIALLEESVKEINARCTAETTTADLKNLLGWMKRIDANLSEVATETTATKTAVAGQGIWLKNINDELQKHLTSYKIHKAG